MKHTNKQNFKQQIMKFRVHHILCTNLYRGLGYSGAFCDNMTQKVSYLRKNRTAPLLLVAQPDAICGNCPNLVGEDYCINGDNHVQIKDRELLEPLHLQVDEIYTYEELMQHAQAYMTEAIFTKSCSSCKWFQQEICRYEDFDWNK